MDLITSKDYRDYVIKDGKFIGAFEEMYQNCSDPWNQDSIPSVAEDIALLLVNKNEYKGVLDLGCGKGRFTSRLKIATRASVTALDVSRTAVQIAKQRYPDIEFLVASVPPLQFPDESFDLVLSAELLWYVLRQLDRLFTEIKRVLIPGGHYLVVQQFYNLEEQKYGKEIMQTPEDLISMAPFHLIHHFELDRLINHKFVALLEKD